MQFKNKENLDVELSNKGKEAYKLVKKMILEL